MDKQPRTQQKQISQLQPSNLQIVKENITQEDVESPVLPMAMTTSHTKVAQVLEFDEILGDHKGNPVLPALKAFKLPEEIGQEVDKLSLNEDEEIRSDFQIQESKPNNFKNIALILGAAGKKTINKQRSLSGVIQGRAQSLVQCLSSSSTNKLVPLKKAKTNGKQTNSERSVLLGIKRAPSELNLQLDHQWLGQCQDMELSSNKKRLKLNDDTFLKQSSGHEQLIIGDAKPSNKAMIRAIDSDEALDYLRVRKQKGVSKLSIKQQNVFERVEKEEEALQNDLDPFAKQKEDIISDNSSIMGDRWYDNKRGADFKFEITSNVDSIEFPMNQNLNLKLNLKSLDVGVNNQQNIDDDCESPKLSKQPFQFTGQNVDLKLQIQNDNLPVKSDMLQNTQQIPQMKFSLSNIKPFDQLLDMDSSENEAQQ